MFPYLKRDAGGLLGRLSREATENAHSVPCWADPDAFLSDSSIMCAVTAKACGRCSMRALCGEYADTADERIGFWGRKDRTCHLDRLAPPVTRSCSSAKRPGVRPWSRRTVIADRSSS